MADRKNTPPVRNEDYASIYGESEAGKVASRAGQRMYENALRRVALERESVQEGSADLFQRAQQAMIRQRETATQPFGIGGRPQQFQQGRTAAEVQMLGQIGQQRSQAMRDLSAQELSAEQQGLEFAGQTFQQFAGTEQYQMALMDRINTIVENGSLSDEQKIRRLTSEFGISEQEAQQLVNSNVEQRNAFVRAFTGQTGLGTVGRSAGIVGAGVAGIGAVGALGGATSSVAALAGSAPTVGAVMSAALSGAKTGALKGSIIPGKGTAIGSILGFLIGAGIAIYALSRDTDKVYDDLRGN